MGKNRRTGAGNATIPIERITRAILLIRSQKVILDTDSAELYEVETKALNRAVKRNVERFPPDFMFELTKDEMEHLRCQIGTSKRGGRRYRPYACVRATPADALHPRGSGAKVWELSVFGDEPDATLGGRLRPDGELADGLDDSDDGFVMMRDPAFELVELCCKFPVCGNHFP